MIVQDHILATIAQEDLQQHLRFVLKDVQIRILLLLHNQDMSATLKASVCIIVEMEL